MTKKTSKKNDKTTAIQEEMRSNYTSTQKIRSYILSEVDATLQNQNLPTDLRHWVAKRIRKSARKFTQNLSSTKVNASRRKWSVKRKQVGNLRRLASGA